MYASGKQSREISEYPDRSCIQALTLYTFILLAFEKGWHPRDESPYGVFNRFSSDVTGLTPRTAAQLHLQSVMMHPGGSHMILCDLCEAI
jgi:hypothetical protein